VFSFGLPNPPEVVFMELTLPGLRLERAQSCPLQYIILYTVIEINNNILNNIYLICGKMVCSEKPDKIK